MIIVLLGKPGCGKGTQAELLSKSLKIPYFTAGKIIRKYLAKAKTPFARKMKAMADKGILIPDEVTLRLIKKAIDSKKSFIFDGFPRRSNQAKKIESFARPDIVFYIDIPDKEVMRRLAKRYQCSNNHIYNLDIKPPKKDMACDICGQKLFRRTDDAPQTLKTRLKVFRKETLPVIKFYGKKVVRLNGTKNVKKVQSEILKSVRKEL
jgi:adenylate kinase